MPTNPRATNMPDDTGNPRSVVAPTLEETSVELETTASSSAVVNSDSVES